MKSLIIVAFSLFFLTSCEVFKTTPRSSPHYRGPGSSKKNVQKKPTPNARTASRPAPRNTGNRRVEHSPGRPTKKPGADRSSSARNTPAPTRRELAAKPKGAYATSVPAVVQIARTYTGTPYRSGGNDKNGIDCSGLICQVYSEIGVKVPRISWQQSEFGREVEKIEEIRPGDWLFFVPEGGKEGYVSHSGIVTEVRGTREILFIHASSSRGVIEDNLFSNYFRNRFVKAVRPF